MCLNLENNIQSEHGSYVHLPLAQLGMRESKEMKRKLYFHISYFFDDSASSATSNLQTLGYSFQSQMGELSLLKLETGIEWGEKKLVEDKPEEIRPA